MHKLFVVAATISLDIQIPAIIAVHYSFAIPNTIGLASISITC